MGMDADAKIIYGYKIDISPNKKTLTKYNEDTGQPYKVEVEDGVIGMIEGHLIYTGEMWEMEDEIKEATGFVTFTDGLSDDFVLIGVCSAEVDIMYGDSLCMAEKIDKTNLDFFGSKINIQPKEYLLRYVSV